MLNGKLKLGFTYTIKIEAPDGSVRMVEARNIVPNVGLDYILGAAFLNEARTNTFYLGLLDTDILPAAGSDMDDAAAGEFTSYSNFTRPQWTQARSGLTLTNAAAPAAYQITADVDIVGLFVSNSANKDNSGKLISVANLPAPEAVLAGSTLTVTASFAFTSTI